jgi:hypothetical protein
MLISVNFFQFFPNEGILFFIFAYYYQGQNLTFSKSISNCKAAAFLFGGCQDLFPNAYSLMAYRSHETLPSADSSQVSPLTLASQCQHTGPSPGK